MLQSPACLSADLTADGKAQLRDDVLDSGGACFCGANVRFLAERARLVGRETKKVVCFGDT